MLYAATDGIAHAFARYSLHFLPEPEWSIARYYDAHDLLGVKRGLKKPWEVQPSRVVTFEFPFEEIQKSIGGVAYNPATAQLFVSQMFADRVGYSAYPLIRVFKFTAMRIEGNGNR